MPKGTNALNNTPKAAQKPSRAIPITLMCVYFKALAERGRKPAYFSGWLLENKFCLNLGSDPTHMCTQGFQEDAGEWLVGGEQTVLGQEGRGLVQSNHLTWASPSNERFASTEARPVQSDQVF